MITGVLNPTSNYKHSVIDLHNCDEFAMRLIILRRIVRRRIVLRRIVRATNRPRRIVRDELSGDELSAHHLEFPFQWAPNYCNMARIWWDIYDEWESTLIILDRAANIYYASRPGYWNDFDILTVGLGGQTIQEYTSQFSLWALTSSPLIAGNDLRIMSEEIKTILTNKEVIQINQDKLGRSGNMIRRALDGSYEVWAKPIYDEQVRQFLETNHSLGFTPSPLHAMVLLNRLNSTANVTFQFDDLFDHRLCPHPPTPIWTVTIRDLWLHQELGEFVETWRANNIPAHGVRMVTVLLLNATSPHPQSLS